MKKMWCWLFHTAFWKAVPVYHSFDMHCEKCDRRWRYFD